MLYYSIGFALLCLLTSVDAEYLNTNKRNDNTMVAEKEVPSSNFRGHGKYIPVEDFEQYTRSLLADNFTCTFAPDDCNNHGVCNQEGTACICNDDYATHDATVETGECNYKRKSGLIALLLSIFVGEFGAVYFYVGDTTMGCIQLFLAGVLAILVGGVFGCCCGAAIGAVSEEKNATEQCSKFWMYVGSIAMIVMYFVVLAAVIDGKIDDSNGVSLSPID